MIISLILIILGTSARLLPHPANVAPIAAIALFAGIYLPRRWSAIVPLVAMFLSDTLIGFYDWRVMLTVYGSFLLSVYFGSRAREQKNVATIVAATLAGSIIFFLTTNAAVWAFGDMYSKTISGLLESYSMALPFFRNSLLGDLFFVGVLFGAMELVCNIQLDLSKSSPKSV